MATINDEGMAILIPNITIKKRYIDGVFKVYVIEPNDGYTLHDKNLDVEEMDNSTMLPTGNIILGFYTGVTTVKYDYDFTANPREFYASPIAKENYREITQEEYDEIIAKENEEIQDD